MTESATNITRVVVDASVAVKWFSKEENSDKAESLLNMNHLSQLSIYAPNLLIYETGNALWKGKKIDHDILINDMDVLFDSNIEFIPLDKSLIQSAASLMPKYDLTFYDAAYVGLACILKTPLVTANIKGHEKIKEVEIIELKEFRMPS